MPITTNFYQIVFFVLNFEYFADSYVKLLSVFSRNIRSLCES